MALEFKCQNCGGDIIVRFMEVGKTAECRSCGSANAVPEAAVETTEEPSFSKRGRSFERKLEPGIGDPSTDTQGSAGKQRSKKVANEWTYLRTRYAKIVRSDGRFLTKYFEKHRRNLRNDNRFRRCA